MGCDTYSVWYKDMLLADKMSLENALIFVKALFEHFWQESDSYIIRKNEVKENGNDIYN